MAQETKTDVITVTTNLDTVVEIPVDEFEKLSCEVAVTIAALDQFVISMKSHKDGSYQTLFSQASDFTTPSGLLVGASGDLTSQAVGSGFFIIDCDGLSSIRIQAASGTTTSGVKVLGSAK